MPNIELKKQKRLTTFRRIAIGTWRTEYDPSVYGNLQFRMDKALRYIEEFREKTGKRLTVTMLVGKALAKSLETMPDANAILRYQTIYLRQSISMSFQVAMTEGAEKKMDLSSAKLEDVDTKPLTELVDEFEAIVERVRSRKDKVLEKTRSSFKFIPTWLSHYVLRFMGFLGYTLNLDLSWAGIPKDPFGSAMVTNIGALGLDCGYVPLVPYSRCPLLLAVGAVADEPVVENGQVVPAKVMRVYVTFDHRIMDGAHAAKLAKVMKRCMEDPYSHFDSLENAS